MYNNYEADILHSQLSGGFEKHPETDSVNYACVLAFSRAAANKQAVGNDDGGTCFDSAATAGCLWLAGYPIIAIPIGIRY
ncbi:MAG: hypothetical protein CMQ15_12340 [Gammaproteobacteria bacterium]|nr:hypothetical protein [Gammaproteobacteria bacterium]